MPASGRSRARARQRQGLMQPPPPSHPRKVVRIPTPNVVSLEQYSILHEFPERFIYCNAALEQRIKLVNSFQRLLAKQKISLQVFSATCRQGKHLVAAGPLCSAKIDAALKSSSAFGARSRTSPHRSPASWALIKHSTGRQNLPDERAIAMQPFLYFLRSQHQQIVWHTRAE